MFVEIVIAILTNTITNQKVYLPLVTPQSQNKPVLKQLKDFGYNIKAFKYQGREDGQALRKYVSEGGKLIRIVKMLSKDDTEFVIQNKLLIAVDVMDRLTLRNSLSLNDYSLTEEPGLKRVDLLTLFLITDEVTNDTQSKAKPRVARNVEDFEFESFMMKSGPYTSSPTPSIKESFEQLASKDVRVPISTKGPIHELDKSIAIQQEMLRQFKFTQQQTQETKHDENFNSKDAAQDYPESDDESLNAFSPPPSTNARRSRRDVSPSMHSEASNSTTSTKHKVDIADANKQVLVLLVVTQVEFAIKVLNETDIDAIAITEGRFEWEDKDTLIQGFRLRKLKKGKRKLYLMRSATFARLLEDFPEYSQYYDRMWLRITDQFVDEHGYNYDVGRRRKAIIISKDID